jgi:hypothetical protein
MLEDLQPPKQIFKCAIRDTILTLEESDRVILKDALANEQVWSHRALSRALTAKGFSLGEKIIRERRAKPCNDCHCR